MRRFRPAPGAVLALFGLLGTAAAQEPTPSAQPDDSRINISGTVVEAWGDGFRLDYADGTVVVEFDDLDDLPEAAALAPGDDVTVHGRIDDSTFEQTRIEARAVFVEALRTYFYASARDEEGFDDSFHTERETGEATLRGTVQSTSPELDTFELDTGESVVTVDTATLDYDPFDDQGYQTIETGWPVSVSGRVTRQFFEGRELEATSVITLERPAEE
jgi:hypothetical protein